MQIRPAIPADVPAVLPMVGRICALHEAWDSAKYGFLADPAARYAGWLAARAEDPRSVFLVAEREEAAADRPALLVGFLIATIEREIPIYRLKEYGFVHDLWIDEAYRNEGLGRQFVTLAVERFTELGVAQIRLDTAARNEPARRLFESCGFRVSTVEMLYEIPAADE